MFAPGSNPAKKRPEYVPGQVILRVKDDAVWGHVAGGAMVMTSATAETLPPAVAEPLDYLRRNAGLKTVDPLFSTGRTRLARANVTAPELDRLAVISSVSNSQSEQLAGINVLTLPKKNVTSDLLKKVGSARVVDYVEPMPTRWTQAVSSQSGAVDPGLNRQWGLRAIQWFDAKPVDENQVKVAVLDTGIDAKHPDLDVSEYHHEGQGVTDILGHGTHVAGIIAARANNAIGITGVAQCRLFVWKIFPDKPNILGDFYVDGERYLRALGEVANAGVRVVNLSIGGTARSETEAILFRRLDQQNVTVVAAMGNSFEEGNPTMFPAAYEHVFAVGSIDILEQRSPFSQIGSHIDAVAPGSDILSTLPLRRSKYRDQRNYASWDGTSMATPHVTGIAARVAARFPAFDVRQVKDKLRASCRKLEAMGNRERTKVYGHGLINAESAVR